MWRMTDPGCGFEFMSESDYVFEIWNELSMTINKFRSPDAACGAWI